MIRYERQMSPAKQEVLGIEDWRDWTLSPGQSCLVLRCPEAFFVQEGRLVIRDPGGESVDLQGGDWFFLEEGREYAVQAEETVWGFRQEEPST